MPRRVSIVGVGLTSTGSWRKDVIYPELVYEAVNAALTDAELSVTNIEAVVYGSMDPFDGVFAPERWNVDACASAGILNKPLMKITTGGTTGGSTALAAYYHVASGLFNIVLAITSQRVGECLEAQTVLNTCTCPIIERQYGEGAISQGAWQSTRHMFKYGTTEEDMALVAVQNRRNALNNPYAHIRSEISVEEALKSPVICWPMKLSDCCPSSDGACALIFASEDATKKIATRPAWVKAAGQISDNYFQGDRTWFEDWDSLSILASKIYRVAKIDNPLKDIDVVELYNAFTIQEIIEYEALGFCERGKGTEMLRGGGTAMGGDLPVNPSGGVLCTNPIGASGMIRVAEAALQVMGKANHRQIPGVKTALAHSWGATIGFHTLMILGKDIP